ncbi:MAG: hypothetical protein JNJ91_05040 [Flavobacteriales bacterium]|nr:hypothetical protein [Flavobacteriales bacterium]
MASTRSKLFMAALCMAMVPGCCCKKGCVDLNREAIKLQGFVPEEVDSVIVVTRLSANSALASDTVLSSAGEGSYFNAPDLTLYVEDLGNPLLQREIIFPRIGRTYFVDGIESELKVCNACIIPGGTDHYMVLERHRVNGERSTGVITLVR